MVRGFSAARQHQPALHAGHDARPGAALAGAGPVDAGMVAFLPREISRSVVLGCGEDVVPVWLVTAPVDLVAVLVEGSALDDIRAQMKLIEVIGNQLSSRVVPRPGPNPIPRRLAALLVAFRLRAQISPSHSPARPGGLGQHRAMCIRTGNPARISAFAHTDTGNEKPHRMVHRDRHAHHQQQSGRGHCLHNAHVEILRLVVRRTPGRRFRSRPLWMTRRIGHTAALAVLSGSRRAPAWKRMRVLASTALRYETGQRCSPGGATRSTMTLDPSISSRSARCDDRRRTQRNRDRAPRRPYRGRGPPRVPHRSRSSSDHAPKRRRAARATPPGVDNQAETNLAARSVTGSELHHDDIDMPALGPVADRLVSIPMLLRQRRSAGCLPYPWSRRRIRPGFAPVHSPPRQTCLPLTMTW